MNQEPELDHINKEDNSPATIADVKTIVKAEGEETRRHFDMAVEHIQDLVLSANRDEISLIKDQQLPDHEESVQVLEKETDVPVGPKFK